MSLNKWAWTTGIWLEVLVYWFKIKDLGLRYKPVQGNSEYMVNLSERICMCVYLPQKQSQKALLYQGLPFRLTLS